MPAHTRRMLFIVAASMLACLDEGTGQSATEPTDTTGSPSSGDLPAPDEPTSSASATTGTSGDETSAGTNPGSSATLAADPSPFCGDGELNIGEECDLGVDNADDGSCTLACKTATCGDGLVWTGMEACDLGQWNSPNYGGCAPDCQLAARCGDGVLDPEHEQCDDGAMNGTGVGDGTAAPCTKACRWFGRIVFITSETYDGAFSGLPWADARCYELAWWVGLNNPKGYRAWLSDGVYSPASRFEHKDDGIPYILLNGQIFAGDYKELTLKGPRRGLSVTENGEFLVGARAWTNTTAFATNLSDTKHCAGWTTADPDFVARTGLNALMVEEGPAWEEWNKWGQWTSYKDQNCQESAHLYCFDDGPIDGP